MGLAISTDESVSEDFMLSDVRPVNFALATLSHNALRNYQRD
jgi:hypothetical protein